MVKIVHVVGARPNFIKLSPVVRAINNLTEYKQVIVHTGQHYNRNMSDVFFKELEIPDPDYNLNIWSHNNHAIQIGRIMIELDAVLTYEKPDLVIVYGDVNSTLAASIACAKKGIQLAHVESGLRSFDMSMPEEINRIITDRLSDILFIHSLEAKDNLINEGIDADKIHFVGNVMIDTLVYNKDNINSSKIKDIELPKIGGYGLVTLHRPSNVDDVMYLKSIMNTLVSISKNIPLVFPVHPRTKKMLMDLVIKDLNSNILFLNPVSYLTCLSLQKYANFVITDSGGIQEETTYLGTPCITVRDNTERMITVTKGTNILVDRHLFKVKEAVSKILSGANFFSTIPDLWDGLASNRIVKVLTDYINQQYGG
jgi:UDP-N-acetylglucosamine 2-epimerase (non-hydrolysing)